MRVQRIIHIFSVTCVSRVDTTLNAPSSQGEKPKEKRAKSKEKKGETDQKQATITKGKKSDNMVFVIQEIALAGKKSLLDEYDILCDNQATINIFRNNDM